MATDYSQFTTAGLTGAQNAINTGTNAAYPNYTGGQKANPYARQKAAKGMQESGYNAGSGVYSPLTNAQIGNGMQSSGYNANQGVYKSLGRDENAIRNDYGATAKQAWNQAQGQIKGMYGANGLYGSLGGGLMSGALQDGAGQYSTAMSQSRLAADNAIMADENNRASSYRDAYKLAGDQNRDVWDSQLAASVAKMTNEQNRADSYRDAYELAGNQNLDQWKAGQTARKYNNGLLGSRAQFGNDQIDAQYQDQLARRNDQNAYNQTKIENYLGLAGGGSPGAAAQMQANAQKSAAESAANASNTGAWLGAAGALGGGLLSGIGEANGWSNFWK